MNRTVNLTKRVQTSRGLRYCPVVLAANGRLRADLVIINGQEERHPEGAYYLEWWEGAKRVRLSVGKDAADANAVSWILAAIRTREEQKVSVVGEELGKAMCDVSLLPQGRHLSRRPTRRWDAIKG